MPRKKELTEKINHIKFDRPNDDSELDPVDDYINRVLNIPQKPKRFTEIESLFGGKISRNIGINSRQTIEETAPLYSSFGEYFKD
jgi:hypothetical protein